MVNLAPDPVSVEPLPKQGCEYGVYFIFTTLVSSQWNPCRSRGARSSVSSFFVFHSSLSGTPAEAGVRDRLVSVFEIFFGVSVEPLPKQGCEVSESTSGNKREVSVEPLPKQGCEVAYGIFHDLYD